MANDFIQHCLAAIIQTSHYKRKVFSHLNGLANRIPVLLDNFVVFFFANDLDVAVNIFTQKLLDCFRRSIIKSIWRN
jgi:hypothetical protein